MIGGYLERNMEGIVFCELFWEFEEVILNFSVFLIGFSVCDVSGWYEFIFKLDIW